MALLPLLFVAACRRDARPPSPLPLLPPPDAVEIDAALHRAPEHLGAGRPIVLTWNPDHRVEMKSAVAVVERGLLKVIASSGTALTCDHPEQQGQEWFSFTVDSGPPRSPDGGDYYVGRSTPVGVAFAISNDIVSWRETYNAQSKFELVPFGPNDETTELRVQWRRVLHNPDPPVLTSVSATGAMTVTLCKSARELFASPAPTRDVSTGPLEVRIGDRTFQPKRSFVFLFDDGKNGAIVSAVGFYDSETADCDATTRPLADDGGGVNGLQFETGQVGGAPGAMNLGISQPMNLEITDTITGGGFFSQRSLTPERLNGSITFTAAHFEAETGEVSGFVHVDGRANRARPVDVFISGAFTATVCKRTYW